MGYRNIVVTFLSMCVVVIYANRQQLILPPNPLGPEAPTCGSHSSLCHLAYNISDGPGGSYRVWHSEQQVCRCTGARPCETDWFSSERSVVKELTRGNMRLEVKMSYCNLNQASTVCRQNQSALVMRGRGAFVFEIWQDFGCRCYRPLYEHRSWREGDYDYFQYSCGKPLCSNNIRSPRCTKITYQGSMYNLAHDYLCRCRHNQECTGLTLPTESSPVVFQTCQPLRMSNALPTYNFLRRRRPRNRRHHRRH